MLYKLHQVLSKNNMVEKLDSVYRGRKYNQSVQPDPSPFRRFATGAGTGYLNHYAFFES